MARARVLASAATFEYWPLSHGLLISPGFQAAGGSSGHSFQGAVALVPGRRLQEIACSARQAEVLPGSGPELEELPRSRDPAVLGANAATTAAPAPLARGESGPQGQQPFQLFHRENDFPAARRPGPVREAPREHAPKVLGRSGIFSCGQSKGQIGIQRKGRRLVQC